MTLRTLNYGNYGLFLIMGNAGFCPSTVVTPPKKGKNSPPPDPVVVINLMKGQASRDSWEQTSSFEVVANCGRLQVGITFQRSHACLGFGALAFRIRVGGLLSVLSESSEPKSLLPSMEAFSFTK